MADGGSSPRPFSPTLQSIVDRFGSILTSEGQSVADSGALSIQDWNIMESTWFDMEGESIISIARQAMDSKMASLLPAPEADSSSSPTGPAFSSSVQQTKDPLAFKVKKRKSSVLDVVLIGDESKKSSKEVEAAAMAAVIDDLISFMGEAALERFYRGLRRVPVEERQQIMKLSFAKWSSGYLRNSLNSLFRFGAWMLMRFGCLHGFKAEPAVVGWFMLDNLVADGAQGHASQSLVSGLRFARTTLKYPIEIEDDSVAALCTGPKKTPKQAPSASVRVVYHFWEVATNAAYSVPLRAMSAAFLIMSLCGLRGVDAQRSALDQTHASGKGWSYFSAVAWDSKNKACMPWACPLVTFGKSSSWFDCLKTIWKDRDYLFPSLSRGSSLAGSDEMLSHPASAYMILKYLREILGLPSISLSGEDAKRLRSPQCSCTLSDPDGVAPLQQTAVL